MFARSDAVALVSVLRTDDEGLQPHSRVIRDLQLGQPGGHQRCDGTDPLCRCFEREPVAGIDLLQECRDRRGIATDAPCGVFFKGRGREAATGQPPIVLHLNDLTESVSRDADTVASVAEVLAWPVLPAALLALLDLEVVGVGADGRRAMSSSTSHVLVRWVLTPSCALVAATDRPRST